MTAPVTFSTGGVALAMDVSVEVVQRYAKRLQGPVGSGTYRRLTPTEIKVVRAWHAITEHGGDGHREPLMAELRALTREAIEANPQRYLVLQTGAQRPPAADMVDTLEAAVEAWDPSGKRLWWLIDLEPGDG